MTLLQSINNLTLKPIEYTTDVAMDFENASCFQSTKARGSAALQIVVSLLALPILLAIGLLSAAFRVFQGEGKQAMLELWSNLKQHVVYAIPTAFVGIFAPLETTSKVASTQLASFMHSEMDTLIGPVNGEIEQGAKDFFVSEKRCELNVFNRLHGPCKQKKAEEFQALKKLSANPESLRQQFLDDLKSRQDALGDLKVMIDGMNPDQKDGARVNAELAIDNGTFKMLVDKETTLRFLFD